MATEATSGITAGAGFGYNYSYTKPIEAEQRIKREGREPSTTKLDFVSQKTTENVVTDDKKAKEAKKNDAKSLYEAEQEKIKKQEEERKKEEDAKEQAKYLDELTKRLNASMNRFSENIKFGVNDKTNSIIVSIIEQNNEKKIKELSKEDAEKLFKRLDFVLGVLFDSKG